MASASEIFQRLKAIETKIVSLDVSALIQTPTPNDLKWIFSLPNLEGLTIVLNELSDCSLFGLADLKRLRFLACISSLSENDTRIICTVISQLPAVEILFLDGMRFRDIEWEIPPTLHSIYLSFSDIDLSSLKTIARARNIRHMCFSETKIPKPIPIDIFHSGLVCIETCDKDLSEFFIAHIEKFPKLKYASVTIPEKNYALIKKSLKSNVNVLRVLILDAEKSDTTDSFIRDMRQNYAIYCDYEDNWAQLKLDYIRWRELLGLAVVVQECPYPAAVYDLENDGTSLPEPVAEFWFR
jgi:hypothetical protein